MSAHAILSRITQQFAAAVQRTDIPEDGRLFLYVEPQAVRPLCRYLFRDLDARYVSSIGLDDRPASGRFLVAHDFAFDGAHVLCSVLAYLEGSPPRIDSIADIVPAA